jgi:hypothetical protein
VEHHQSYNFQISSNFLHQYIQPVDKTTATTMAEDKELDGLVDAFAAAGPSSKGKKEVTYADFEKMLNETPLFMRSSPEGMEDNEVLQGLRSLVFEGEGDGMSFFT